MKITYRIEVEQDDTPVRGNAMASGDDAADRALENEIIARLENGDVWAWAHVTVFAECEGFVGSTSDSEAEACEALGVEISDPWDLYVCGCEVQR